MLSTINNNNSLCYENFKPFSNKVDLSSNKTYLKNAYGTEVKYYNDPEEKKKSKRNYLLVMASVAIVLIGALIAAVRTKKIDVDLLMKETEKLPIREAGDRIRNAAMDFTNVKDDLWDRFACFLADVWKPLSVVKDAGAKLSSKWLSLLESGLTKRVSSCQESILKLANGNKEILSEIGEFKKFNYSEIYGEMKDVLQADRISKKAFSLDGGIKGLFNNLTSPLADNKVAQVIKNHVNLIDIEALKGKGASEELLKEVEKYNTLQLKELFPKLRDLACGSAPTDILTAAIPILGFGIAVKNTDDKQKRDSLIFNVGFPLLPTCLMPLIGLKFPILNGFRGLMTGLAVGQASKQTVRYVDKKVLKNNNNSFVA